MANTLTPEIMEVQLDKVKFNRVLGSIGSLYLVHYQPHTTRDFRKFKEAQFCLLKLALLCFKTYQFNNYLRFLKDVSFPFMFTFINYNWQKFFFKNGADVTRTSDFRCRKRQLYQLSHQRCQYWIRYSKPNPKTKA